MGIAKALGESIPLSYGAIAALCVGCGVLRGGLRYLEQYGNHYIAFRLLAVLRDKIFTKLRTLCPAKLENRQKGSLLTMITADIETLEVFYAHTVSPVCIAVLVSAVVMVVTGLAASWYLSLIAAAAYLCIGVLLPRFFSRRMADTGMRYRRELGDFGAYFLDSIKGIRELVLYNAGEARAAEVDRRSNAMLGRTKTLKWETALSAAATEAAVSLSVLAVLAVGIFLVHSGSLSVGRMVLGVTAVFGSFGRSSPCPPCPQTSTRPLQAGSAFSVCWRSSRRWRPWRTARNFPMRAWRYTTYPSPMAGRRCSGASP